VPGLEVRGLDVAYGRRQVLSHVDLDVASGQVVALLGNNGAGKTTVLRAVSGLTPASGGRIRFGGVDVTASDTRARFDRGIVQMPAGRAVFPSMTVLDNLLVGCHRFAWERERVGSRLEAVVSLFPRLGERLDQRAATLSGGEQHMLALAKALLPEPKLLLIDELSLGLAHSVVAELLRVIAALARAGTSVVMVEQSATLALSIAGHAVWLEKGEVSFAGTPADLLARRDLTGVPARP